MIRIQNFNFTIWLFLQMSKLLCNVLKISGGAYAPNSPPGCAPGVRPVLHLVWVMLHIYYALWVRQFAHIPCAKLMASGHLRQQLGMCCYVAVSNNLSSRRFMFKSVVVSWSSDTEREQQHCETIQSNFLPGKVYFTCRSQIKNVVLTQRITAVAGCTSKTYQKWKGAVLL